MYIDLAGLLIVVLLWVLFTTCHLCSHGDTCRVSGNCVCRHLTSASFSTDRAKVHTKYAKSKYANLAYGANTRHQYAFAVNTREKKRSAYYKTRINKRFITGSIAQYLCSMYTRLSMVLSHSYTRITIRITINVPRQNKRTIFVHIRVLREYAVVLYITINMLVEMKTTKRSNIPLNRI